jgi:hypothetical protein
VITQYPESLPTTPPAPACPSFRPNSEQRFTPNNSEAQNGDFRNPNHLILVEGMMKGERNIAVLYLNAILRAQGITRQCTTGEDAPEAGKQSSEPSSRKYPTAEL